MIQRKCFSLSADMQRSHAADLDTNSIRNVHSFNSHLFLSCLQAHRLHKRSGKITKSLIAVVTLVSVLLSQAATLAATSVAVDFEGRDSSSVAVRPMAATEVAGVVP